TYIVALDYLRVKLNRLGKGLQGVQFLLAPAIYKMVITGVDRYETDYPFSQRIGTYQSLKEEAIAEPYVAIAAFTETLNSDPQNIEPRKGRVSTYFKNRQFREAEADLKYLEQIQGETPFSQLGFGIAAFKSRQNIDQAHQLFEAAISLENSTYRRKNYYYQRAEIYRQIGRHREAITDYSAAIEEDILFEDAYLGRAQSRHALSDLEGALADLVLIKSNIKGRLTTKARSLINAYLKTPPRPVDYSQTVATKNPRLQRSRNLSQVKKETQPESDNGHREYLVRGLRYFYEDDFEAARKDFYRVISHNPKNSKAYFMLGEIAAQHDFNHLQACVFFKESYRLAPDTPDYLVKVSRCLYREHQFSATIQLLSSFIDNDKASSVDHRTLAQIYFLRGLCLEEAGQMSEALKDMLQAVELDSSLKAAALFIKDHRPKTYPEAVPDQEDALPAVTTSVMENSSDVTEFNETGRQQLLQGDVAGAKVSFLKAIRFNPESSSAYHQLGRLYSEHEQHYDKAKIYYSQAIERDSQIAHYYYDRAAIHFYFKQYDQAKKDFSRVLDLQPTDSQSLYYRGVCNHYLGQIEEAQKDFQNLRQLDEDWNIELERFRNAWKAEVNQFLEAPP
ncbi:MAG: tetratricopeptide repeat protein, partial [Desulfocapsaceae bacterium]